MINRCVPRHTSSAALAAALSFSGWLAVFAFCTPSASAEPEAPDAKGITAPSIATSLPYDCDPTGIRKLMAAYGATFNFIYTNDELGNVNGGLRRGFIDQGKLEYNMTVDFEKLIGWQGLSLDTNGFLIHNIGRIRRDYVGGITRLPQSRRCRPGACRNCGCSRAFGMAAPAFGPVNSRPTSISFTPTGFMFLQTDWPTISAVTLPSGGPAYPLSTPGVRREVEPAKNVSVLAAVFNGDPAGPGTPGDEQLRNKYGVNFRLKDPPFVIAEDAQFRTNHEKTDTGLAKHLETRRLGAFRQI